MTPNEYQDMCLVTESMSGYRWSEVDINTLRLLQGLVGLVSEAGEALDILKKHLFQGHPLDKEHLAKELGDVSWYLSLSSDAIDYHLEDIFRMNIDKLKARYPGGFEAYRSMYRQEDDI